MKNGLNFKRKLVVLMLWTFMCSWAKAQPNLAFYPLEDQFNSFDYNPAFLTSREKFTFSIFPLAATTVGYNNQEVIRDMTSKFIDGVITNDDYKNAFNKMINQSSFLQNAESSLLSFTYRSKIGFFNFRIKDSEYFIATVEGGITKFIFKPEISSVIIDQIQTLRAQTSHYREYSLGYSYKSRNKRLTSGIRAKLYFGKFAFFSNISGSIQRDPGSLNDYILKASGLVNISFPENTIKTPEGSKTTYGFSNSKIRDYVFNTGNPGMGVDLGIKYQYTPELTLSISIIDLGKINWKSNLHTRKIDQEYELSNYEISPNGQTITKTNLSSYSDTINFSLFSLDSAAFSRPLPMSLYGGIKYQVNPGFSLSITDRYVVVKDLNYNSLSVSANFDVSKKLSISTGYSMIADSYFNIPLALLVRGNRGQFFLGTDNLTSIVFPSLGEFAGISFGACFYLFTRRDLSMKPSDLTPFYRPRKIIKRRNSGLIINERPEY